MCSRHGRQSNGACNEEESIYGRLTEQRPSGRKRLVASTYVAGERVSALGANDESIGVQMSDNELRSTTMRHGRRPIATSPIR